MRFTLVTAVDADFEKLESQFDRELLEKLLAPGLPVSITRFDGLEDGDELHLRFGDGRFSGSWVSRIQEKARDKNEWSYVDVGVELPPPLKSWRHKHRLLRRPAGGTFIRDEIEFSTGSRLADAAVFPLLYAIFASRGPIYRHVFGSPASGAAPM